ncbi:unnamed protein product, partial [Meganyctiphanes norvegica]
MAGLVAIHVGAGNHATSLKGEYKQLMRKACKQIMDGRSLRHGAVGAVPGVRNPILLAREILEAQAHPQPGGLVPPSFLAGSGAQTWAESHQVEICQPQDLIA